MRARTRPRSSAATTCAILRARRIEASDFETFDRVLAMDSHNLAVLQRICPHAHKLALLCDFHEQAAGKRGSRSVSWWRAGLRHALDLIEKAMVWLLERVRQRSRA